MQLCTQSIKEKKKSKKKKKLSTTYIYIIEEFQLSIKRARKIRKKNLVHQSSK